MARKGFLKMVVAVVMIVLFGFLALFMNSIFSEIFSGFTTPESKFLLYLMIPALGGYLLWNLATGD